MATLIKLTDAQMAEMGITRADEFASKLSSLLAKPAVPAPKATDKKDDDGDDDCPECDGSGKCGSCDGSGAKGKKAKASAIHAGATEAQVQEMISVAISEGFKTFASSEDGKKILGAQASRITMEALASVGTVPAKPAPASSVETPQAAFEALEKQGKFEEAYAHLPANEKRDFNPKTYAAFRKANAAGAIRIARSISEMKN